MYYAGFEAQNGCEMSARLDCGMLCVEAHPPEWARPEYIAESVALAAQFTAVLTATGPDAAEAWLARCGVPHAYGIFERS